MSRTLSTALLTCAVLLSPVLAQVGEPVRTLYLVRHGAYDDNAADNAHAPLIALGVAQARLLAARLKAMPGLPESLTSSTMTRAEQTAAVIDESFPGLAVQHDDRLRECEPPTASDRELDPDERKGTILCQIQLDAAFAAYLKPAGADETDILVCHGNVIRYLVAKALGMDTTLWTHFSVGHTSVTEIKVRSNGRMQVIAVGDVGHLPYGLQSGASDVTPSLAP